MSNVLSTVLAVGGLLGILTLGFSYFRINTAKVWRETSEGWKARAEQLEETILTYVDRVAALEAKVAELQRRPDLDLMQQGLAGITARLDELVTLQTSAAVEVEGVRVKADEAAGLVEGVRVEQADAALRVAEAAKKVEAVRLQQVEATQELRDAADKLKAENQSTTLPVTETPKTTEEV